NKPLTFNQNDEVLVTTLLMGKNGCANNYACFTWISFEDDSQTFVTSDYDSRDQQGPYEWEMRYFPTGETEDVWQVKSVNSAGTTGNLSEAITSAGTGVTVSG